VKSKDLTNPAVMADEFAKAIIDRRELVEALNTIEECLLGNGEWDEGCFYYANRSAPELQRPLKMIEALLNRLKESK